LASEPAITTGSRVTIIREVLKRVDRQCLERSLPTCNPQFPVSDASLTLHAQVLLR
jgi:hypothetical protein